MKTLKQKLSSLNIAHYLAIPALASLPMASQADVPAEVTTAITAAGTDVATIGGAVLVVVVGIYAFKFLRRAL